MPTREINGDRVALRLAEEGDLDELMAMLAEPGVQRWWGEATPEQWREQLFGEDVVTYVVTESGTTVGLAQYWEQPEPNYRHAGIDLAIRDSATDRGLGKDSVRALARHLLKELGHHRVVIDPAVDNERAIACFESVGFRRVGVMRRYERAPAGNWRDSLLLDLLPDDLD